MIVDLPLSVFSHIREFIVLPSVNDDEEERDQTFKDWRNFCNLSKHYVCSEIKKKYSFYNLNASNSFNYICYHLDQELDDEANLIICRLLGNISHPKYQVFLNFGKRYRLLDFSADVDLYSVINSEMYGLNVVGMDRHLLSLDSIVDLPFLSARGEWYQRDCIFSLPVSSNQVVSLKKLNISCGKDVTNDMLPIFSNLQELSLDDNTITDVSPLKNIRKLSLSTSNNLVDASSLRNVYDLDLSYCDNIVDVSALGKVHRLNLSNCKKIVDVSALGKVYDLKIDFCKKIKNISALDHVPILSVRGGKGGKLPPGLSFNNTSRKLTVPLDSISLDLLSGMKDKNKMITLDNFVLNQPTGLNEYTVRRWHEEVVLKDFLKGYQRIHCTHIGYPVVLFSLNSLRILHLKCSRFVRLRDLPALEELWIDNGAINRKRTLECFETDLPQLRKLTLRNLSFTLNTFTLGDEMFPLLREFILEEFADLKTLNVYVHLSKLKFKNKHGKFDTLLINILENGSLDIIDTSCAYRVAVN
jgi:hypothetical protein